MASSNWLRNLFFKFTFLSIIVLLFSGCTAFVSKPIPPSMSSVKGSINTNVKWPLPNKPLIYKYKTEGTSKNPVSIDDITVEVVSIGEGAAFNDYSINCTCADDTSVNFPVFPVGAQVKITNDTDHIVALGQTAMLTGTVIKLEDEHGNDYPLYTGEEWRTDAQKLIATNYDQSILALDKEYDWAINDDKTTNDKLLANYKSELYGSYANGYDQYLRDFNTQSCLQCLNPGVILLVLLTGTTPNDKPDTSLSPNNIYTNTSLNFSSQIAQAINIANVKRSEKKQQIFQKKAECLTKLAEVKAKGLITGGAYPAITIFPKKNVIIYVPFIKKEGDYLDKIKFMLYDLPTKLDAAGMPTKRSNFDIMLKQAEKI